MEGPSVLRLWPGLYFDSDTGTDGNGKGGKLVKGEGLAAKMKVLYDSRMTKPALNASYFHPRVVCLAQTVERWQWRAVSSEWPKCPAAQFY